MAASILLESVAKHFGREWILRDLNLRYEGGGTYGIRGRNGSGKSTLMRLLAGQLTPSRGRVTHRIDDRTIAPSEVYRLVSWMGPYIEVVEELTAAEWLRFHFALKPARAGLTPARMLERTQLQAYGDRRLSDCSSGMRQRLLLATVLYADTPIVLVDEPTLTLDTTAAAWFSDELETYGKGRLVIIASNDERDLAPCSSITELMPR